MGGFCNRAVETLGFITIQLVTITHIIILYTGLL
jgi:hypothetical protein